VIRSLCINLRTSAQYLLADGRVLIRYADCGRDAGQHALCGVGEVEVEAVGQHDHHGHHAHDQQLTEPHADAAGLVRQRAVPHVAQLKSVRAQLQKVVEQREKRRLGKAINKKTT
jgi:hypothetical protein